MLFEIFLILIGLYSSIRFFPRPMFRFISCFCGPIVRLYICRRIAKGLEDKCRVNERFGIPSQLRPAGDLLWIHAVSVGETLSVIPIIEDIKMRFPDISILLTTTTLTSAEQVEKRLKGKVIHQFVPFDIFMWIRRFVKYWKPFAAVFVESELWPNTLYYLHEKDIPTYLVNVRISDKSMKRMSMFKKYLGIYPFSLFTGIFAPSAKLKSEIKGLGANDVQVIPNLKAIAEKLPVNVENKEKLIDKVNGRKIWMALSTHPGEEELILAVHKLLKEAYPDILTVIAIRHPSRSGAVQELTASNGLSVTTYATSIKTSDKIVEDIFILDEIGRLGEFFEIVNTVLVCGSLISGIGGHNFLEPIKFSCDVATGPYIDNFKDIYPYVEKYCGIVNGIPEICEFVKTSLNSFDKTQNKFSGTMFKKEWEKVVDQILKNRRYGI